MIVVQSDTARVRRRRVRPARARRHARSRCRAPARAPTSRPRGRAQRRGGRRVVPPPRRGPLAPGGRDARARARAASGAPEPLSGVRAAPVLHERVRRDRGARRRGRDLDLHGAPRRLGGAAEPGAAFRRPQRLAATRATPPRAVVGAGGAAAVIYSTQHVPLRAGDGLQLHRALPGVAFGPAEHVNGGGGVTVGRRGGHARGPRARGLVRPVHGARVHVSEAAPRAPLVDTAELGADVRPKRARGGGRRRRARRRGVVAAGLRPHRPTASVPLAATRPRMARRSARRSRSGSRGGRPSPRWPGWFQRRALVRGAGPLRPAPATGAERAAVGGGPDGGPRACKRAARRYCARRQRCRLTRRAPGAATDRR